MPHNVPHTDEIWFVYDGECPLCASAAMAFQIRKAVGNLHLVDARSELNHPVLSEINTQKMDLDEGMVIKYGDKLYHGADALHLMALLGSNRGWINRFNALFFRSRFLTTWLYPVLRGIRNLLIRVRGVSRINNLQHDDKA